VTGKRGNQEGSIYPYRNGFAAYVWITTPTGRRQRKYVYGKTRDVVHGKWLELHRQAARGPVATRVPTVEAYMAEWLAEVVRPNLAPATTANYAMFTRLYVAPDLGGRRLDKLTVRDVRVWVNELRQRCQCCAQQKDAGRDDPRCCALGNCCRQVASEWTVHQAWTVLRAALANAVRDELVARNVAALVRVPIPRPKEEPRRWTVEEARQFLESARTDGDSLYAAFVLLLVLGLRRGKLLGLAWPHVDLDAEALRVVWQLQRVERELIRRPTKTRASAAQLPLPGVCVGALRLRQSEQEAWRAAAVDAWDNSADLVFTTRHGRPIDPRNFHRRFKERCSTAGVPVISVHATRRTCASLLVALDIHPRVVMQILRHSQIAVTMNVYSEVYSEETREALRKLGESLGE
jgi:integrase